MISDIKYGLYFILALWLLIKFVKYTLVSSIIFCSSTYTLCSPIVWQKFVAVENYDLSRIWLTLALTVKATMPDTAEIDLNTPGTRCTKLIVLHMYIVHHSPVAGTRLYCPDYQDCIDECLTGVAFNVSFTLLTMPRFQQYCCRMEFQWLSQWWLVKAKVTAAHGMVSTNQRTTMRMSEPSSS